ncbi:hypothetical protein RhiirA4_483930 [Rhizophagus irregularis]|uniref:Uncharacterized protein n=1 Tax=Rhizophagus irregularis TaxID=588596 RepID=A0A2I1HN86_9GLOM|nr:hypothetical protein RhiirA4_483930 [Rhizophagus irregularis]
MSDSLNCCSIVALLKLGLRTSSLLHQKVPTKTSLFYSITIFTTSSMYRVASLLKTHTIVFLNETTQVYIETNRSIDSDTKQVNCITSASYPEDSLPEGDTPEELEETRSSFKSYGND